MNTQSINTMPWLVSNYTQLIRMYAHDHGHHALLLQSTQALGEQELIQAIGHYLLCQSKQNDHHTVPRACGACPSCQLIQAGAHPDWHVLVPEKDKKSIGVDAIRHVIHQLHQHANQDGAKVVQIEQLELLTEAAANALLKILEEPSANTFFLLTTYAPSDLLATIKSRCLSYPIVVPSQSIAIEWLQTYYPHYPPESLAVGLRLAHGAPLQAFNLLEQARWSQRLVFNQQLFDALKQRNYLSLIASLSGEEGLYNLECLMAFLLDALKYQSFTQLSNSAIASITIETPLTHLDRLDITLELLKQGMARLVVTLQHALHLNHTLRHNIGLNRELLITNWLLAWQQKRLEPIHLLDQF